MKDDFNKYAERDAAIRELNKRLLVLVLGVDGSKHTDFDFTDFRDGIGLCFGWIVPKIEGTHGIGISFSKMDDSELWLCEIEIYGYGKLGYMGNFEAKGEYPAIAFCEAAIKVFDDIQKG